jgi:hypothetical protein
VSASPTNPIFFIAPTPNPVADAKSASSTQHGDIRAGPGRKSIWKIYPDHIIKIARAQKSRENARNFGSATI